MCIEVALITNLVGGLAFGSLLFLVSAGFTQILGLMRIINAAQTSFYILGAYIGLTIISRGVDFWLAGFIAAVAIMVLGGFVYQIFLKANRADHVTTLFVTIAFSIIFADAALAIWGGNPQTIDAPALLDGSITLFGSVVPKYWVAVIGICVLIAGLLYYVERHTLLGAIIRAGVDDGEMVRGLGINIDRVFLLVFCMGSALAGLGGLLGGPVTGIYPGLDLELLPLAFAIVILGGMGSLVGAFVGSMIIGVINNFGIALFPEFSYFTIFAPVVIILAIRPQGLFGRTVRQA